MSMDEFDDSELNCGSESSDQADLTFFCGTFSRLVHMTEEQSEKCGSMEAMLVEIQNTLSQLSNQLGIHPIEAETSRQTLPVPYSDLYIRDAHSRFPLDNSTSLLPEFDGSNASDWLSKVERFFRVGRYSDLDKLDLVAFSLEGDVLKWFNWEMTRNAFHTWDEFRRRLFLRFAATPEASSETVTDNLEARASFQVPVSSLESGLSFSSEILDVSVAWPSDMVSINRVHSQAGFECVKNKISAHHVLDEMLLRRHKFQQRKKPSLSPKSRMFKFKQRTLLSNWSQMDLHQVIDINKVNNLYPCFSANFGLVRQKKTIPCLRLKKQAHKSRVLYQLRMLHDSGGKDDEHSDDINYSQLYDEHKASACAVVKCSETATYAQAMQTDGWDEACAAARDALERTGTWIVTSLPANNIEEALLKVVTKPVTEGKTTGFKEVFPIGCQGVFKVKLNAAGSLERFTARLVANGYTQRGVDFIDTFSPVVKLKPGYASRPGDLPENAVLHLQKPIYGLTQASRQWYSKFSTTLMTLGFTKSFTEQMFHRQQNSSSIWHRWRRKPLFLPHFWKKNCWYPRLFLLSGLMMIRRREFLIQWQNQDASQNSWMLSKDFVLLYPVFKLEDKLRFEGGSIDMNHQVYYRKKNKKLVVEANDVATTSISSKDSDTSGGFAVVAV